MSTSAAAFLPLTLAALSGLPVDNARTSNLVTAARRTERLARDSWQTLLSVRDRSHGTEFTTSLRRLSLAVGGFVGDDWSNGVHRGHRDRVGRYQWWLEEALADGDGAEFAEAFARFDDALARAIVSSGANSAATEGNNVAVSGGVRGRRQAAAVSVQGSGTMAGWARAATSRAVSPLRWATNRHAMSSSKWSRHLRSAG